MVKGLFFLPTCACVDYWADVLPGFLPDIKVFALHGKMKQKRSRILESFRNAENTILLCTDLLARWVFFFISTALMELPNDFIN